jgi:hypothetical protein
MVRNLAFTLDREPGNVDAARALDIAKTRIPRRHASPRSEKKSV